MFRDQAEVVAYVQAITAPMIRHVVQKYDLKEFNVQVRTDFGKRRTTSLGGVRVNGQPYISLAVRKYNTAGNDIKLREYAHIDRDPEIGSVTGDWKDIIAAIAAHELAHAVQHFRFNKIMMAGELFTGGLDKWPSVDITSHGELWQSIYRDLRCNFVNNKWNRSVKFQFTPTPIEIPKVKRAINKPFFTREVNKDGGRHAIYYRTSDKTLIGKLFKREYGSVQFAPAGMNKYERTKYKSVAEARKALIEPLI